MKVKICGITNKEDALNAVSLGADALGFIFSKSSPRYISPEDVEEITMQLPPFIRLVGVFVNETAENINKIMQQCKLDLVQLHGDETPDFCLKIERRVIKAFKISDLDDLNIIPPYQGMISGILLDTKSKEHEGGTGKTFDWGIALKAKEEFDFPIILAGGINIDNIEKAIKLINPYALDISSGVETEPGKKDYNKMKEILKKVKNL